MIAKTPDPVWTPPEWHYYEKAAKKGLEAVRLEVGDTITLEDGSILAVTDSTIGRINQFGHFAEITPGVEIIFDGRIFIPPLTFPQRRVPDALGPFKLDMGDGYLIHGTHYYNEESIGEAVYESAQAWREAEAKRQAEEEERRRREAEERQRREAEERAREEAAAEAARQAAAGSEAKPEGAAGSPSE